MRDWPDWLESLRPDEFTSVRLRHSIAAAAEPLLEARRDDVWNVASRWAGLLTPAAAVLALVFGGLAMRDGAAGETVAVADVEPAADVVEVLRSETVPAGFSESTTDEDLVFAALGEAARLRPRAAPGDQPGGPRP